VARIFETSTDLVAELGAAAIRAGRVGQHDILGEQPAHRLGRFLSLKSRSHCPQDVFYRRLVYRLFLL